MTKPQILMSCGGTGGHIYPLIALAQHLPDYECVFFGSDRRVDEVIVPKYGYTHRALPSRGRFWLVKAFWVAATYLWSQRPKVVIGSGGKNTFPVVIMAWLYRIPIILCEQNAIAGRTNRWLRWFATHICVSFKESIPQFTPKRVHVTGNPVRKTFLPDAIFPDCLHHINPQDPVLLVIGGSQGAHPINDWMIKHADQFFEKQWSIILLTGPDYFKRHFPNSSRHHTITNPNYSNSLTCIDYTDQMDWLYDKASFVCCRAGATTIAELVSFNKPTLFIPYPHAADNHQQANAKAFCDQYQGWIIKESELSIQAFDNCWKQVKPNHINNSIQSAHQITQLIHSVAGNSRY